MVNDLRNVVMPAQNIEHEEFASVLMKIGMKRNVAKVLTYMSCVDEATSRDIEKGSDLRQPEVSIAMRELRKLDWVSERDEKNPGKGRPFKIYKLKKGLYDIIDYLEENKRVEMETITGKIQKLKELKSS